MVGIMAHYKATASVVVRFVVDDLDLTLDTWFVETSVVIMDKMDDVLLATDVMAVMVVNIV